MFRRQPRTIGGIAAVAAAGLAAALAGPGDAAYASAFHHHHSGHAKTATPIKHLVVIFGENISFDHYFGTYPNAANTSGSSFTASSETPSINGLTPQLLTANPNGVNPRRYSPDNVADLVTCDQDHNYGDEQKAFDGGKMDQFPQTVGAKGTSPEHMPCVPGDVMNYYDGNTVTGLWNYAQRYAMSDNSFGTTYGPSTPGAINLASGNTGRVDTTHMVNNPRISTSAKPNGDLEPDGQGGYSLVSDAQPYYDDCSTRDAVAMQGRNIGDELNAAGLSWGWFQGGFRPTTSFQTAAPGQPTSTFTPDQFKGKFFDKSAHQADQGICNAVHPVGAGLPGPMAGTGQYGYKDDYIPHHEPFQYYATTANPHHLTLATNGKGKDTTRALRSIGRDTQSYVNGQPQFDTPNHQYDTSDFDQLVAAISKHRVSNSHLPAVSFLKAPGYQDGHAGYSDPIDEQRFVVDEINALQRTPDWKSTAVVLAYDDSDGWYDHAYPGIQNPSSSVSDALTGTGSCGQGRRIAGENGRCGFGPRLPLLVISPWAKANSVDHTLTDQSSIIRFVEDNWSLPRIPGSADAQAGTLANLFDFSSRKPANGSLFELDPMTGRPRA